MSVYGAWPNGPEHTIFVTGFSLLSAQMLLLLICRLTLLRPFLDSIRQTSQCCNPVRVATVSMILAAVSLVITAIVPYYARSASLFRTPIFVLNLTVPYYASPVHIIAACFTFGLLGVAMVADCVTHRRLTVAIVPEVERGGGDCWQRQENLLLMWRMLAIAAMVSCFSIWLLLKASAFEYVAATMPFMYVLSWCFDAGEWAQRGRQVSVQGNSKAAMNSIRKGKTEVGDRWGHNEAGAAHPHQKLFRLVQSTSVPDDLLFSVGNKELPSSDEEPAPCPPIAPTVLHARHAIPESKLEPTEMNQRGPHGGIIC